MPQLKPRLRKLFTPERMERLARAVSRFKDAVERGDATAGLWVPQSATMAAVADFLERAPEKLEQGQVAAGAIVLPTGGGKTVLAAVIAKTFGLRAMILVPTLEIIDRHLKELQERAPEIRVSAYHAKEKDLSGQVIVTTYQSAVSLLDRKKLPEDVDIAFDDEAHLSISPRRGELHGAVAPVELALTASPVFNPVKHIWNHFERIVEIDLPDGMELGIIAPVRAFVVETKLDLSKVSIRRGENALDEKKAAQALNVLARNRAARDFYLDGFRGVAAFAPCIDTTHAEEFAAYMAQSGVKATFIHGGVDHDERRRRLQAFEDGSIDLVTTRDVLIHGWDSQRVLLELNIRPTYSRVVKTHMVGRVLRQRPGKEYGIVAEFQDVYRGGEQPLWVHHLFERTHYRQGGLVGAPKKMREEEERKLGKGEPILIRGELKISHETKEVAPLAMAQTNFQDPAILREILASHPDIDFTTLNHSKFRYLYFAHPLFQGTGLTLLHRVFGIPQHRSTLLTSREDYEHFRWYVLEDEMIERMDRFAQGAEDSMGPAGSQQLAMAPDEGVVQQELNRVVQRVLLKLRYREEKVIRKRFGIGEPELLQEEIGDQIGVGRERVRQIENKVLRLLRHPYRSKYLKVFARPIEGEIPRKEPEPKSRLETERVAEPIFLARLTPYERYLFRQSVYFLKKPDEIAQQIYGEHATQADVRRIKGMLTSAHRKLGGPTPVDLHYLQGQYRKRYPRYVIRVRL